VLLGELPPTARFNDPRRPADVAPARCRRPRRHPAALGAPARRRSPGLDVVAVAHLRRRALNEPGGVSPSCPPAHPAHPALPALDLATCAVSVSRGARGRPPADTIFCSSVHRGGKTMMARRVAGILPPLCSTRRSK
jgi:hypothetical protein